MSCVAALSATGSGYTGSTQVWLKFPVLQGDTLSALCTQKQLRMLITPSPSTKRGRNPPPSPQTIAILPILYAVRPRGHLKKIKKTCHSEPILSAQTSTGFHYFVFTDHTEAQTRLTHTHWRACTSMLSWQRRPPPPLSLPPSVLPHHIHEGIVFFHTTVPKMALMQLHAITSISEAVDSASCGITKPHAA